jgi:hypothetical protein
VVQARPKSALPAWRSCAYGTGEVLDHLHTNGINAKTKVQPPNAPAGKFTKDQFGIDLRDCKTNGSGTETVVAVIGLCEQDPLA